jgi:hypothetical protein
MSLAQVWTHSLFFTFSELKFSKFGNVNTLRAQLIFPPKSNFCNLFEFSPTKFTQKSISSTHYLCEIKTLLNLTCQGLSHNTKNTRSQIPIQFSVSILFNSHQEKGLIINCFHTVAPNSLKPSQCTPTHRELSENIKSVA